MSYEQALEAAGAVIHCFQQFGSYQGDWWAKITFNGVTGWINGSYGSCSGCDAFESEFGWNNGECEEHQYYCEEEIKNCPNCKIASEKYYKKLADFGIGYLDWILTQSEAEAKAGENIEWDFDAKEMVDFIKNNAVE